MPFKTIHAAVRPTRVAVLIEKNDTNWRDTCLRIIEFHSRLWGGAYNIIVPTDGVTIDERFWAILETFDADRVYRYQKSVEDIRSGNPDEYAKLLEREVDNYVAQIGATDRDKARAEVEKHLRDCPISPGLDISPKLQQEIKVRVAPCYFQQWVVEAGAIGAASKPGFPLTDITNVIANTTHQDKFAEITVSDGSLPKLWFSATTGLFNSDTVQALGQLKITPQAFTFDQDTISQLIEFVVTGALRKPRVFDRDNPVPYELEGIAPYRISMLQLGLYRSTRYRDWEEPLLLVAGDTLEDFCLYYCLSRLRDRVVWMLPSIVEKAIASSSADTASRTEIHFLSELYSEELSSQTEGRIACISYSLSSAEVDAVIEKLNSIGFRRFQRPITKLEEIQPLIELPLTAVERDNFQRDLSLQFSGDASIGPVSTPKPKHFQPIHPYEHRYFTQLSITGEAPPKHFALGAWVVADRRLTTHEVRVGREGPAYFCPNVAYFGGDIDTVLVRPSLYLPPLHRFVDDLARDEGYECRPSDKGIYAEQSILKWGGLREVASFLRDPSRRAVLDLFLNTAKSEVGKGVYLGDRRRYLDFQAIKCLLGDAATDVLDELISKQILYRGFIFACSYCRNADWFAVGEITQEFKCRRCGRMQVYSKENWRMPDEPSWFYKLDELIYQGYKQGMGVPLLALDYLKTRSRDNFSFTTDREFWKPDAPKPDVEADFFCVSDGVFTAGEAKTQNDLGKSASEEVSKISKYKHLAKGLAIRRVVFATIEDLWRQQTRERVMAAFADVPYVRVLFLDASHLFKPGAQE